MQYLLLIYNNENEINKMSPEQLGLPEYGKLIEDLKKSGGYLGGNRLQPTTTATTVRVRDGKPQFTDGPFAETREQLGGFFLVEAKDLDEATKIAARIPGARHGSIEVRPIWQM